VRILVPTDSFPPNCGGSGWSTYELVRGLRARGHDVAIVQPRPGPGAPIPSVAAHGHTGVTILREYDGFSIEELPSGAPPVPFVRNYFKNERLWRRLEHFLADRLASGAFDIVHAQHVLTTVPAIRAARRVGTPVVATVRDYWPVCYWSTILLDPAQDALCPACTVGNMARCLRPRSGAAWPVTLPLIPYMRRNLARKRTTLAEADAVIAVSSAIAGDLAARAPELSLTRIVRIPNPVDIEGIRHAGTSSARPIDGPYVLYSGKLESNKGADLLVRVAHDAGLQVPLVLVGDGRLRSSIQAEAREAGLNVRVTGWLPRKEALRWVRHATVLVFPSRGPESLSRVLLEAAALGVPIAAMNTGGTPDIVGHEQTGLLSQTAEGLARDVARLLSDSSLATRLAHAACDHVERTFDQSAVVDRVQALYEELVTRTKPALGGRRA
jgi:glycogen(starch) synthase